MKITFYDNGKLIVSSHDNGALFCYDHQTAWCDHIREVIEGGLDAEAVHEEACHEVAFEIRLEGVNDIVVPLVPSRGIFVRVHLVPIFRKDVWTGSYAVLLLEGLRGVEIHESGPDFRVLTSLNLGMLNEGEGRKVLREMIINWFFVEVDGERKCKSIFHHPAADLELAEQNDRGIRFSNTWILCFHRKCLPCFEKHPEVTEVWSHDLIPDDIAPVRGGWKAAKSPRLTSGRAPENPKKGNVWVQPNGVANVWNGRRWVRTGKRIIDDDSHRTDYA